MVTIEIQTKMFLGTFATTSGDIHFRLFEYDKELPLHICIDFILQCRLDGYFLTRIDLLGKDKAEKVWG